MRRNLLDSFIVILCMIVGLGCQKKVSPILQKETSKKNVESNIKEIERIQQDTEQFEKLQAQERELEKTRQWEENNIEKR